MPASSASFAEGTHTSDTWVRAIELASVSRLVVGDEERVADLVEVHSEGSAAAEPVRRQHVRGDAALERLDRHPDELGGDYERDEVAIGRSLLGGGTPGLQPGVPATRRGSRTGPSTLGSRRSRKQGKEPGWPLKSAHREVS